MTTPSTPDILAAARKLAAGELVAFATETVYGLGARADSDEAVARIFAAKGRPSQHPLIVHVAGIEAAQHFAGQLGDDARRLMAAFWPGPVTLIVPRRPDVASAAAGGQASIGLRWPSHPLAMALLREAAALGVPGVAAPSANRFGRVSPTSATHVRQEFGPSLMVLDGGPCELGIESAIIDCTRAQPALLRPGSISQQLLAAALGRPLAAPDAASPRASGTLVSHYAPSVPLRLLDSAALQAAVAQRLRELDDGVDKATAGAANQRVAVYSRSWPAADLARAQARLASSPGHDRLASAFLFRTMPEDPAQAAHELFASLRDLETAAVAAIWVEQPPPGPAWDGVRDRLSRAAA